MGRVEESNPRRAPQPSAAGASRPLATQQTDDEPASDRRRNEKSLQERSAGAKSQGRVFFWTNVEEPYSLAENVFAVDKQDAALIQPVRLDAGLRGRIERLDEHDVFERDQTFVNAECLRHGNLLKV